MNTAEPDQEESADTERPDDPVAADAARGKTRREPSNEKPRPQQPSQQHNRGPPLDEPIEERIADDVLLGAKNIAEHITALGFPVDETNVYYLHRAKKWPFNKYGIFLIASKKRLTRHVEKLLRGPAVA